MDKKLHIEIESENVAVPEFAISEEDESGEVRSLVNPREFIPEENIETDEEVSFASEDLAMPEIHIKE